jgi:sigma-B regulation protein RsbU (phosphoserine phosphatase)
MTGLPWMSADSTRGTGTHYLDTRLGRTLVWVGGLSVVLMFMRWITHSEPGTRLHGWATFSTLIFLFLGVLLFYRWATVRLLWRLRNRLYVAYIFIGVIPVLLLLLMAGIGSYLLAGQFATYVAITDLHAKLQHLDAENEAQAARSSTLNLSGGLNEQTAGASTAKSNQTFRQQTVTVWRDGKSFSLNTRGGLVEGGQVALPRSITGDFNGIVVDGDSLHLRAVKRFNDGGVRLTIISDVPVTPELLQPTAARLGAITVIPPDRGGELELPPPAQAGENARKSIDAGRVAPPANRIDPTIRFYTLFNVVDWESGKSQDGAVGVVTRPSMLYTLLFATLGDKTKLLWDGLLGLAIFFGLIEVAALSIALRLSRSMTRSVANLYNATEHVNRGDLAHRIPIRGRDQMAELEQSFNSMAEALVKLVAEQKEKQRLESELVIAHEVQELLFPHTFLALSTLEVYGICSPARSVSGDYYDFISLGANRLALAVGDISGKGISAALLMATVHAFVRAYSLEPDMVLPSELQAASPAQSNPRMYYRGDGIAPSQLAPGMLMTTLNYQLFRCTPPEKYATMFLGCYDAASRELKYCNAGHPLPILLRADGTVSRLQTSGTVIGLFEGAAYDESTVTMRPGDLLVAFSDGVTEPENESGEFGEERLIALIQEHRQLPLAQIGKHITSAVESWIGEAELPDDVTVVLARSI